MLTVLLCTLVELECVADEVEPDVVVGFGAVAVVVVVVDLVCAPRGDAITSAASEAIKTFMSGSSAFRGRASRPNSCYMLSEP